MAMEDDQQVRTCVVLGGRGCIGRSLVTRLLKLGNWTVRVADSAHSLQLDASEQESLLPEAILAGRASYFRVDVRDKSQIIAAFQGSSVVFYCDEADSYSHDVYLCYTIIVQGVKNVINACRECKVKKLIYNSSADVVFDGLHDICSGDESLPYAGRFDSMLNDLKAQAEALVLFANNIDGLLTCALRPSNVFGPGDKQLVPFLLNTARSCWGKFITGSGKNMLDFTYVENVAHAHICAEETLGSRMVSISGKVFFITNIEPMNFWEFASLFLEGLGYRRPIIKAPARIIFYIVLLANWICSKMDSRKRSNLVSICDMKKLTSRTMTFNCAAAKKHIGYSPVVSLEEGIELTIESFSRLAKESSFVQYSSKFEGQSKVEELLGSGKVAEILLWRDEKKTFIYFIVLFLLYHWFFLTGRTFISSMARLLLLILLLLSGYARLPPNILSFTIPRISSSCFEISEEAVENSVTTVAYMWNKACLVARSLARGDDWITFFKVALSLYTLKWIVSFSLTIPVGLAMILSFTLFFIYEQYELEIDGLVRLLSSVLKEPVSLLMRHLPVSIASFFPMLEEKEPTM